MLDPQAQVAERGLRTGTQALELAGHNGSYSTMTIWLPISDDQYREGLSG